MSPAGWKPSPRVSLQPCRPLNDPPISLKSEKPCAQNSATPRASGPPTTSASASPPARAPSQLLVEELGPYFFPLREKDSILVLSLRLPCAVGCSSIEQPRNKRTTIWYSYLVRAHVFAQ